MSIYRTILEEELDAPILDDNNSPEIKEIENIVADQDANDYEQDEAQEAEFGPDDGVSDILDETAIAIAEAEQQFNQITMAIGLFELNETASGRDIIYEAVDIKGYFEKVKTWVVNFFKKVWQVLQRFAANITSAFRTNTSFLKKYGAKLSDGYAAFKNDGKIKLKMYDYKNLTGMLSKSKWSSSDGSAAAGEIATYKSAISAAKDGADVPEISAESVDDKLRAYRGYLMNGDGCDAGEFREKMMNYLRGGDEKKEDKMSVDSIKEALGAKDTVKACKKAIDDSKKDYKKTIGQLNELQRSLARKLDKANADTAAINKNLGNVYRMTDMVKGVLSATQVARACVLSAVRARTAQARMYGQAYIAALNKTKYKGFQKESTEYGFLSNLELV